MKDKTNDGFRKKCLIFGMIGFAILVTINLWGIFYFQNPTVLGKNYDLLNPARKIFNQNDLIINFQPLRDYLNDKYAADPDVSIYFEFLNTGANISISKDAEFYPASLLKVPVAMAVAKKIEKGDWKWSNQLVMLSSDKDENFGDLYKQPTNSVFTIEELVRRSLADSDNTAHFILLRNLEMSEVSDVYDHIGLEGYFKSNGKISAKRYSVIFRALYNASYISEENSEKLIKFLALSPFNEYIQSGLPKDVVFSHKIGISGEKGNEVILDSGIVYAKNRPYLLIVMVKNKEEKKAKDVMKDVSGKVYEYVKDYGR